MFPWVCVNRHFRNLARSVNRLFAQYCLSFSSFALICPAAAHQFYQIPVKLPTLTWCDVSPRDITSLTTCQTSHYVTLSLFQKWDARYRRVTCCVDHLAWVKLSWLKLLLGKLEFLCTTHPVFKFRLGTETEIFSSDRIQVIIVTIHTELL